MFTPFKYESYELVDGNKILKYFVNCKTRASAENIMKEEMFYHECSEEVIAGAVSSGSYEDNTVMYVIKTTEV